jgi:N-methylhydantoinase B/oxoprolinase/acetone carboxylase alpha subunit
MIAEKRALQPTDKIYDLVDVVEGQLPETKNQQEVIVIDGRGYDRVLRPEDKIYDLHDVFAQSAGHNQREQAIDEEFRKIARETAEKIARELIPEIAERIIRQEIEKLKSELDQSA